MSTRAPSLGRGCRAQRGGVGFLLGRRSPSSLPSPLGKGDRVAVDRVLSLMAHLRRSFPLFFIPLPPSNLRPFGAPPSIGRREYPREPLPLEGAAERSEAGLAFFFAAKPPPLCLPHWGRGTASAVDRVLSFIACLRRSFPLFFIPLVPYPPLRGTFPSRGRLCPSVLFFHICVYLF